MDRISREKRSEIMSRIRSRDTGPEMKLRKILMGTHLRFHPSGITGNPDFAHKGEKVAVFIDGCFWHGCPEHFRMPKSNIGFWEEKITRNRRRDMEVTRMLRGMGWIVVRIWEHDIG